MDVFVDERASLDRILVCSQNGGTRDIVVVYGETRRLPVFNWINRKCDLLVSPAFARDDVAVISTHDGPE